MEGRASKGQQFRQVICYVCGCRGHMGKNCPTVICWQCGHYGHRRADCPAHSQWPCETRNHRLSRQSKARSRGREEYRKSRLFAEQTYGNIHSQSFHLPRYRSSSISSSTSSASTTSSRHSESSSSGSFTAITGRGQEQNSALRDEEAVKRVAEAVFKFGRSRNDVMFVMEEKKLEDFHLEEISRFLSLPSGDESLRRGDFDVLIIHRSYGYILIEVKAVGDTLHLLKSKTDKRRALVKKLEKAAEQLEKNRRALKYLQPRMQPIPVVATLALPNLPREDLHLVLGDNIELRKKLARCIRSEAATTSQTAASQIPLEAMCLCRDDLPRQHEVFDEDDEDVMHSLSNWWSALLAASPTQAMSNAVYEFLITSFSRQEKIKTFPQAVSHLHRELQAPELDDDQQEILECPAENVFVTGPPGAGKTLILACKAVSWIKKGEKVFVIHKHGNTTTQPAAGHLCHLIDHILGQEFPRGNVLAICDDYDVDKFVERLVRLNSGAVTQICPVTQKEKNKLAKELSSHELDHDIKYFSGEETVCRQLNVVIDEVRMRVRRTGVIVYRLIDAIKERVPHARVWCAGSFDSYCPRICQVKSLHRSYRCPPRIQRLLKACEPFCQSETDPRHNVYHYTTSSTDVPFSADAGAHRQGVPDTGWRIAGNGFDPHFISHAAHTGCLEIWDCAECGKNLADYLTTILGVGTAADTLAEGDVVIAVTGPSIYRDMARLRHSELYKQLLWRKFKVKVLDISDEFSPASPEMVIMHVRTVAGIEKGVVVYVPCQEFQTHGEEESSDGSRAFQSAAGEQSTRKVEGLSPRCPGNQGDGQLAAKPNQDHSESGCGTYGPARIRQILDSHGCLTVRQRGMLSRLRHLNLHWLWYAASRSQSHVVVFVL